MLKQTNNNIMSKSCNRKINKTRYDDPGKPIKPTSFTVKNLEGNLPKKKSTTIKRSFRSSTKSLSLDSTIPVDELTAETFYHFRASKLFNIWTPPFLLHGSQYVTNSSNLKKVVGYKVLRFMHNEDQDAPWVTKPFVIKTQ